MTRRSTRVAPQQGSPSPRREAPGPLSTRVDTATHALDCEGSSNCSCGATAPRREGARTPRGGGVDHVPGDAEPGVSPPSPFSRSESETSVYLNSDPDREPESEPITKIEAGRHAYESLIALCRTDPDAFNEFVLRDEETGERIEQSPIHVEMQAAITKHGFVVILAHPESGKALPLTAEVATPSGWRLLSDLRVGDEVLGGDGLPARVLFVTETMHDHALYDVVLDDGAIVRADSEHRWKVRDSSAWRSGRRSTSTTRVLSTVDLLAQLRLRDGRSRWALPVAGPLEMNEATLPVPPYVLGAWLGDGDSDGAWLTFAEESRPVWDRCLRLLGSPGGRVLVDPRSGVLRGQLEPLGPKRVSPLRRSLRGLGVLGEKHVPEPYLEASRAQREELLAGLLDTDGSAARNGRVEYTSTSERLARDVLRLVRSLGFKATIAESAAKLDGVEVSRRWRVCFTATRQVFRLERKAKRVTKRELGPRLAWRQVVDVRPAPSEPVRCIQVSSPDSTFVTGRDAVAVTHNTQQIGVGRTLFKLGKNPNLRTVYLNNGQDGAKKTLSATKKYIERSQELRAVFPKLRPGNMWREDAITIEREGYSKDPSIYCIGFHGNILGARIDWAVIDDLLDYENTRTAKNRADTEAWLKRTFLTRLSAHAEAAFLTNAWHEADLSVTLPQEGWHRLVYPVLDAAGQSTWPSKWPLWRIKKVRARGELEFARSYLCKPRDPGAEVFGAEALSAALLRGKGYGLVDFLEESEVPRGGLLVSGVDLGASKKMTGGETSIGSVLHYPHGTKQLVALRAGRWSGRKILENLAEVGQSLGGVLIVENNGVQQYIIDLSQEEGEHYEIPVPVLPFYTGKNKHDVDLGVDAMGAEFEGRRWLLPSGRRGPIAPDSVLGPDIPREVVKLLAELAAYSPNTHPGDRLMSVWMARTWGVQRLARQRKGRGKAGVSVSVIG